MVKLAEVYIAERFIFTRNFFESQNPRFIIKSGFKSRAGYNGARTVIARGTNNLLCTAVVQIQAFETGMIEEVGDESLAMTFFLLVIFLMITSTWGMLFTKYILNFCKIELITHLKRANP